METFIPSLILLSFTLNVPDCAFLIPTKGSGTVLVLLKMLSRSWNTMKVALSSKNELS